MFLVFLSVSQLSSLFTLLTLSSSSSLSSPLTSPLPCYLCYLCVLGVFVVRGHLLSLPALLLSLSFCTCCLCRRHRLSLFSLLPSCYLCRYRVLAVFIVLVLCSPSCSHCPFTNTIIVLVHRSPPCLSSLVLNDSGKYFDLYTAH